MCTADPTSRLKTASKQEILEWLASAQSYLSSKPEMVIKSFKVTGISLAMDGSEDNLLHSDIMHYKRMKQQMILSRV